MFLGIAWYVWLAGILLIVFAVSRVMMLFPRDTARLLSRLRGDPVDHGPGVGEGPRRSLADLARGVLDPVRDRRAGGGRRDRRKGGSE